MLPIVILAALIRTVSSQTWTSCNPLHGTCPADPALAGTTTIDFTKGASDAFKVTGGSPSYESDGIHLSVAQQGQAPTLTSNWYMMFGRIDVKMKAAPGQGIVSSLVLQSDDLDEIDFEWIGSDSNQVQSNYFGKGQTLTYDRGAFHSNPNNHDWHTYSVEFTSNQIVWQVDGVTVRALTQGSAEANQYPQTPMQLKFGIWSGGDPSNSAGTVAWAGGPTNYAGGPYTMVVASITAVDYSTGSSYTYGDTSGNWQSIKSNGGTIDGNAGGSAGSPAPSVTEVSTGDPTPFGGTHRDPSSFVTPSVWPWVPSSTGGTDQATQTAGNPGLPSGWTAEASGKVVPPSAACATTSAVSSSQSASSSVSIVPVSSSTPEPQPTTQTTITPPKPTTTIPTTTAAPATTAAQAGSITTVVFNSQGFATTIVVPQGWTKQYDGQGFLILPSGSVKRDLSASVVSLATATSSGTMSGASTLSTSITSAMSSVSQALMSTSSSTASTSGTPSSTTSSVTSTSSTGAASSLYKSILGGSTLLSVLLCLVLGL